MANSVAAGITGLLTFGSADGQSQTSRQQPHAAADHKNVLIIAEVNPHPSAGDGRAGAAQLVEHKNQPKQAAHSLVAESASNDRRRCRPRRIPIQAVNHGEDNSAVGSVT